MQPNHLLTSLQNFQNYINKTSATNDFVIEKLIMASSADQRKWFYNNGKD